MSNYRGPYLLGPNNTPENGIYTGDALALLADIPSATIDCLISDPPFLLPAPGHGTMGKQWCGQLGELVMFEHSFRLFFSEFRRVMKETGQLYLCCHDRSYPSFFRLAYTLWPNVSLIVWYKPTGRVGSGWRRSHELIMHGAWKTTEYTAGFRQNVIGIMPVRTLNRRHPAEKPGDLIEFLLEAVPKRAVVLDCFLGTGTTAVASKKLGYPYIGFEIDPDMAEMARERVRMTQMPLPGLIVEQPELVTTAEATE